MVYLKKNLRKKKKKKTHHTLRPLSQIFWTLTTPTSSSTPRFIFILTFYPCFSPFNPTPSFHSSPFLPPALVSREDEAAPIHWELNGLSGDSYQSQPFHTGAQFFVFLLSVLLSNHLTALQQKKKKKCSMKFSEMFFISSQPYDTHFCDGFCRDHLLDRVRCSLAEWPDHLSRSQFTQLHIHNEGAENTISV